MNSIADVWNSVLMLLRERMTETAMNTWFADCEPIDLSNGRLVICAQNEFKRNIIVDRFADTIRTALSDLFSGSFELQVLTREELEDYDDEKPDESTDLPEIAGYTFDRFIVGPSNKFAHAAAVAVAEKPGKSYNPLFIYGNSGLGKTHLLLSIGQAVHQADPKAKIAYIKGDEFTNQMIASIREGTAEEFRTKYRGVNLFLVDDVQFIAGKQSTQEEFFHTFNSIHEAGNQIVVTSDRPPIEMKQLDDRLRTRFESGLMCDVQPPDMETRMAIIRNKASQFCMPLEDEVVAYIAENLTTNVRQIEGVVNRLTAYRDILNDSTINIASVKRAIKDVIRVGAYIPTPDVIIEETARFYSLTSEDLRGQRRSKNMAMARQISMYLIRSITNLSLMDIGREYENRNHSTVLQSIRKVEELLRTDPEMADAVRDITSNINSRG
ncbi:MAG: chromosomal replication initiator protein DnaA [Oscillospiraceae bacterium]|nr:chromosomal replication initiator protein DnaA [Oscillospiraceae bacterium]